MQDNMDDMIRRKRKVPKPRKLNREKARDIYRRAGKSITYEAIADEYGVTCGTTYGIARGRIWKEATKDLREADPPKPIRQSPVSKSSRRAITVPTPASP